MNTTLYTILILTSLAATSFSQNLSPLEEEAKTNKRLLPLYGLQPKSEHELEADRNFVTETMKQTQFNGERRSASNHLIQLGFTYLYRQDLRTAMYRFNQAYLLDSTNTDIYWGYGAFYMTLGNYEAAKTQYLEGLSRNPNNTQLLTDYGTYFMSQYFNLRQAGLESNALANLESAIVNLEKSVKIDNEDQNTLYKLSVSYWMKGDCDKAWEFYDKCKTLGGQPITEGYTNDLKQKCKNR